MGDPRLGWWLQLVDSAAFDEPLIRDIVTEKWGTDLVGACICDIDWPVGNPMPNSIAMYGTAEDTPPDFDMMSEVVRPHMEEGQYFAFVHMKDTVLAKGGIEYIVITKNTVVKVNGQLMIEGAVNSALSYERIWVEASERDASRALGGRQ
jgi:hypothetical protein